MESVTFFTELRDIVAGTVKFNEPLKDHTSFRIGGPASALVIPRDEEDVRKIVVFSEEHAIPLHIIGNGTKILAPDKGIDGIVIKISKVLDGVQILEDGISTGSGAPVSRLSEIACQNGLSGLEFAIGIPGTIGGAVVMNAGAHGRSISDVVESITVLNPRGDNRLLAKEDLKFRYRGSILQESGEIVLKAKLKLLKDEPEKIRRRLEEFVRWRKKTQPLGLPNVGSIFKNPEGDSAGRLIEAAGLKNVRIGGAQISGHHANFIVNLGNSSAHDVLMLIDLIQKEVYKKFGISLVPEVRILGKE